jgi:hypothetical protein
MKKMQNIRTWRDLLRQILEDPHMKQHVAASVSVSMVTLGRWVNGGSMPRDYNMRLLLKAIPSQYVSMFRELIAEDFESLAFPPHEEDLVLSELQEPPATLYARVMSANATNPRSVRVQAIYDTILQYLATQCDADRLGILVSIVRCVPPCNRDHVRSLRESTGMGTFPWERDQQQKTLFLGSESLAGYSVATCRPVAIQSPEESQTRFPAQWTEHEQSAAAHPIMHGGDVAGCLLVSSTQPRFFTPYRLMLIERCADLLTLAFEPGDFYKPTAIRLFPMPHYRMQRTYFANFNQRVSQKLIQSLRTQEPIDLIQAQQQVWQEIEEEFLQMSYSN